MEIGWIGVGRMGLPMATRLVKAGHKLKVWNRTRAKAEPLAALGAVIVDRMEDLRHANVLFTMLATGHDLEEVCFGTFGLADSGAQKRPRIIVDCSTIGLDESKAIREKLTARGVHYLAAPVSGNPQCVVAGLLSTVVSGPRSAFDMVEAIMRDYALGGVSYAGEGDLSRICKIAHNVFLAGVIEHLIEVTLLAQKAGVPRHAFLNFINGSVLGSVFTTYKSPGLVNLDFPATFTPTLLRKDIDLGLAAARELGVPMPGTVAVREVLQAHFGVAQTKADPDAYLAQDFNTLIETMALHAGITLTPENVQMPTGFEI
ncbi:MAG TPA: NAD(P)-dependent oxidoreductase [Magnetospirillaceae bacterium]|jgi:3-hydroxyisobutyrate dehydrogenase